MNNSLPYQGDLLDFHDSNVNAKRDSELKSRLVSKRSKIQSNFDEYRGMFNLNTLVHAEPKNLSWITKDDFLTLYRFRMKVYQSLKVSLTTDEFGYIQNTCQNCTINEINSFDHILPKEEFPEFVNNPLNLFPSCTHCNSLKSTLWRRNGTVLFLNLYLDALPAEQYLFAEVNENGGVFQVKFRLRNQNNIESALFNLIVSHYSRLNLLNRFELSSSSVISELTNSINAIKNSIDRDKTIDVISQSIIENKAKFGANYWKEILKQALIANQNFRNFAFR